MELPWLGTVQHGASTGIWRTTSSRHSQRPLSARNELWSKRTAIPGRRNAPRTCDHHVWRHVGKTRHAHCSGTEVSLATGRARSPRICVREKWSMLDDKNGRSIAHTLSQEFSQRSSDHAHDAAWHRYSPGQAQRQNANSAIVYPMPLVRAILKALRRELAEAGEVGNLESGPSPHEPLLPPQQSDVVEELQAYWGDVKGGWLDPALVRKARQDEVNEFQGYGVIDIVPHKQFEEHRQREAQAGRKIKPIDTLWSDTNKSTEAEAEMRSRLCAREIKRLQEIGVTEIAGLFASMPPIEAIRMIFSLPPIEAIRMIFSLLMSRRLSSMGKNLKVRLLEIKKAYFNALAIRDNLYIEVSVELIPKDTDLSTVIGILRKSMFGPRDCKRQLGHGIHLTLDWSWLDTRRSLPNHLHKNGHGYLCSVPWRRCARTGRRRWIEQAQRCKWEKERDESLSGSQLRIEWRQIYSIPEPTSELDRGRTGARSRCQTRDWDHPRNVSRKWQVRSYSDTQRVRVHSKTRSISSRQKPRVNLQISMHTSSLLEHRLIRPSVYC